MKKFFTLLCLCSICYFSQAQMIITGVLDGPLTGGTKVMEVYAINAIPDISIYGVELVSNGGGSSGNVEYQFPAVSVNAGEFVYFSNDSMNCFNYLGFYPDGESGGTINFNGDDALILYENGAAIDVFGEPDIDGTGSTWEYMDTWAYRNDFTGPDGGTFVEGNWTFGTVNELDGDTLNATSSNPFPFGTYQYATPANPVVSFLGNMATVGEAVGTTGIDITITAPNANPTTVNIMVDPSSTADASDYSLSTTSVTFPGGSMMSQTVTVTVNDDAIQEMSETLVLNLDSPSNMATLGGNATFTLTINDNDTPIPDIVITEIMYNVFNVDSLEYIEIYNNDVMAVDLAGFSFTSGVNYDFAVSTIMNPGDYLVITDNSAGMQAAFGVNADQWPSGEGLNNNGETITLVDASGNVVDQVTYDDSFPFPMEPDGFGPSLELCDVNEDNDNGFNWLASVTATGFMIDTVEVMASPGMANGVMCPAVINPAITFIGNSATYNESTGTASIDVAILSGNANATEVTVSVDGASTADGMDYTYTPVTLTFPAGVTTDTQTVTLVLIDDVEQESSETIVLTLTGNTNDAILLTDTYVITITDNDTPPAELAITEFMYNVVGIDSLEFIEIQNIGATSVDVQGVSFTSGIAYTIQNSQILDPGDFYVVCNNSSAFQNAFGINAEQWTSNEGLNNSGELIIMNDASGNIIDSVAYNDNDPFPSVADGFGPSLELCTTGQSDNNNPANWYASTTPTGVVVDGTEILATPGTPNTTACGTVLNDPIISFSSAGGAVNEADGSVTVDVTLTNGNDTDTDVTVTVTAASTATDGDDFTVSPTTITFPGGTANATETVTITIIDDTAVESDEDIVLAISGNNGAMTGANSTHTIVINDNDVISVDELFLDNVSLMPNPVSEVLVIDSKILLDDVRMINILGQTVYREMNIDGNTRIDVSQLPQGLYFVHMQSGDSKATYQIVVE